MITWIGAACGVAVVLAAVGLSAGRGKAAEIKVYTGGAPKEALIVLTPQFEKQTGHKVNFTYAVIAEIQKKLAAGEKPDMVLMPVPALDALIKAGTLKAQPRPVLASVGIGVIVREGAPRPDISTPESFKNALLKARSVVHANPKATPSGAHLAGVIDKLGIADAMQKKLTYSNALDGGVDFITKGEVEIGIYPISEVIAVKGISLVGPLPPSLQSLTVYGAGVLNGGAAMEPAEAFVNFLAEPANRSVWKTAGFEPPQ
jgi:molybdate transport system substrate-binding protein